MQNAPPPAYSVSVERCPAGLTISFALADDVARGVHSFPVSFDVALELTARILLAAQAEGASADDIVSIVGALRGAADLMAGRGAK